ncbi:MAG TPA: tyrosine-type recombinase/integrase [Terriglobales bacterium]|nr:tyrosine-type recombinase/integrase [Terriglobales bacterium]
MTEIPGIEIFVRHSPDCKYNGDERYKGCRCRKHLRWSYGGKQYRQSAKTRSWSGAERARRELELKYEAAQGGQPVTDNRAVTVEQAVTAFMAEKRGGQTAVNTLAKYKLTLARLQEFCDRQNITFVREIGLQQLSAWREEWAKYYSSAFALRNNQSRIRHFFRYCKRAKLTDDNPAADLSAIKVTDDDFEVDPFTEQEYKRILKAIPGCDGISDRNQERVSALIQLQRWAGLSLVDAVCLGKDELVKVSGNKFRVDTSRRKTGSKISNPIPGWLGNLLLKVKNGNEQFFFWSGESTTKSATSVYDKLYRKVFDQAGIVNGGSHRLRHLFAVHLLEIGIDIRVVSRALGHKSLAITERYYAKWSRKQQASLESALTKGWAAH